MGVTSRAMAAPCCLMGSWILIGVSEAIVSVHAHMHMSHVRFQLARQRGVSLFLQTDFFSASFIYFIYLARHLRRRAPYATAIIRYAHIFYDTDNRLTKVRCYHPRHCCTVTPLQVPVVPAVSFCLLCIG